MEFKLTLKAAGNPPAELVRREVWNALEAHFSDVAFGDKEQYEVTNWRVETEDSMDPDVTLECFRSALKQEDYLTASRMADALDHYLSSGGFLPRDWERK